MIIDEDDDDGEVWVEPFSIEDVVTESLRDSAQTPEPRRARLASAITAVGASAAFHGLLVMLLIIATPRPGLSVESDAARLRLIRIDLSSSKPSARFVVELAVSGERARQIASSTPASERIAPPPPDVVSGKTSGRASSPQQAQVASILEALRQVPEAAIDRDALDAITEVGGAGRSSLSRVIRLGDGGAMHGGAGRDTRAGSQIIKDGVGELKPIGGPPHEVRARVTHGKRIFDDDECVFSLASKTGYRGEVQRVVDRQMSAVTSCYERALTDDPFLGGRMVVDWRIGPDGAVVYARQYSSTLSTPAVAMCVLSAIRTWRFASPACTVKVRLPYYFTSMQEPALEDVLRRQQGRREL